MNNLLYYGIAIGLGFIFSFTFWESKKIYPWIIVTAFLLPIVWTIILPKHGTGTNFDFHALADAYDIRNHPPAHLGKGFVVMGTIAVFESFFFFSSLWMLKNRFLKK